MHGVPGSHSGGSAAGSGYRDDAGDAYTVRVRGFVLGHAREYMAGGVADYAGGGSPEFWDVP